jgi:hypothetical protein
VLVDDTAQNTMSADRCVEWDDDGLSLQTLAAYELGQRQCTVVRLVELCAAMDERPEDLLTRVQRRVALDQTDRVRINLSKVAATTHPDLLPLLNSAQDRLMNETPGSPSTETIQVDLAALDALATLCGVPPAERGRSPSTTSRCGCASNTMTATGGRGAPRSRTRSRMGERGNPGIFVSSHNVGGRKAS